MDDHDRPMSSKSPVRKDSGLRRFLSASAGLLPPLSGFEITRLSWARKIASFEDLPGGFQPAVMELLADSQDFPYSVLTPTFEGFLRRENSKLIFNLGSRLHVLEDNRASIIHIIFPVESIHAIEFGTILLKAWMKLRGIDSTGQFATTTLHFNTVTDHYFQPFVNAVRSHDQLLSSTDLNEEQRKFASLASQHFKFMNYARRSLLPGERVVQFALQPEIRVSRLSFWGRSVISRLTCPAHILILTDSELIWIRDDQGGKRWRDNTRYGGIWTYLPLSKIQALQIRASEDDLIHLILRLPTDDQVLVPFATGRRTELNEFSRLMREYAPHIGQTSDE